MTRLGTLIRQWLDRGGDPALAQYADRMRTHPAVQTWDRSRDYSTPPQLLNELDWRAKQRQRQEP